MSARLRGLLIDVTPLRASREFRLLWTAQAIAVLGRQAVFVAVPYQVYVMTGSSLAVGLLSLGQAVPLVIAGLYGGALADRYDRRQTILWSQALTLLTSLALAIGAIGLRAPLWFVFTVSAVSAATSTVQQAARSAMVPRLVGPAALPAALSLNQVILQLGFTAGPAVAGVVIAVVGLTWAYWLDVATMLMSCAVVWFLAPSPGSKAVRIHVGAAVEGLREVWKNQVLAASFLADLSAMVFGMPRALFPAIALSIYRVGPTGLGLLYAAPGAGALLGTFFTGWVSRVRRQGRAVVVSIAIWGVGICVFALASLAGPAALPLGLAMLAIAGAADMVSALFRGAILQQTVPDEMRGRMSAFNAMVVTTGPRFGDFESGVVAGVWGVFVSVLSGGVLCLVGLGAVVWLMPTLARYRVDDQEPAPAGAT